MKRKIFTSLLVAPLAFNALAAATVNGDLIGSGLSVWTPSGISGTDIVFGDKTVTTSVAGGSLKRTLKSIDPGTYKITFGTQENVMVNIAGKDLKLKQNTKGWYVEFNVESAGDVELIIKGENASKNFSFSNAELILDFDFETTFSSLNSALVGISLDQVPADAAIPEAYRQEAANYRTRFNKLTSQKTSLQTDVNKLDTEDNVELLTLYNTYKLWDKEGKVEGSLQSRLNTLKSDVKTYNDELAAAIEIWNRVNANQTALNVLNTKIGDLQALIDAAEASVTDVLNNPNVQGNKTDAQTYIDGKVLSETAQESLDAYKTAVENAYSNLEASNITDPEGYDAVKAECDALAGQFSGAVSVWNAYTSVIQLQAQVTAALSSNLTAIDNLEGVEGKTTNFDAYKKTVKKELNDLYANALSQLNIKVGTGIPEDYTIDKSTFDIKTLNGVKQSMEMIVEDAQNYVTEQNNLYTDYTTKIGEDNDNLDQLLETYKTIIPNLPDDSKYNELLKAAQDAISTLTNTVNNTYEAGGDADPETAGLVADAYATELADIDTKVTNLSNYLEKWQPIVELISDFDALEPYIQKLETDGNAKIKNTDYNFSLVERFRNNINNIQTAIDNIKQLAAGDEDLTQNLENTQKAIDDTKADAKNMMDAYVAAATKVVQFNGKLTDLDGIISGKTVVGSPENEYNPSSFKKSDEYTSFDRDIRQFQTKLENIKNGISGTGQELSNQQVYENAIKFAAEIQKYGIDDKYNSVLKAFEQTATEKNYGFVDTAIKNVKEAWNESEYYGKNTVDFTAIDTELSRIRTALNNAEDATAPSVIAFNDVDTDLSKLLGTVNALQKTIDDLKDNQAAYGELKDLYDGMNFADEIKKLYNWNQTNSMAPAVDHYSYLIGGSGTMVNNQSKTSLYNQSKALLEEIENTLTAKTAVANKAELEKKINNLSSAITKMYVIIDNNNATYKAQMAESDVVRARIDEILKALKDADEHAGKVLPESKEWQDSLTDLRNTALPAVDVAANNHYGNGESDLWNRGENINDKEGIDGLGMMNRYEEILTQANKIYTNFTEQYGDLIIDTNIETVADANWDVDLASMENTYIAAIQQYNAFYTLENVNYKNYILPIVGTHKVIFDYYKAIKDVKANVQKWIDDQNTDKVAFTPEAFNEACVAAVNEVLAGIDGAAVDPQPDEPTALKVMKASIDSRVNLMLSEANAAAQNYYNGNGTEELPGIHPVAQKIVTDAKDELTTANIDPKYSEALTTAEGNLTAGENMYKKNSDTETFSLNPMDQIANWFEEITKIDLQPAAVAQWNKYYVDAETELGTLTNTLNNLVGAKESEKTALAGKVTEAGELNGKALADKVLIDSIANYKTQLDAILAAARKIVSDEETRVNNDQENEKFRDSCATTLADLNSQLDALKAYAAALMGGQGMTFSDIETLIKEYKTLYTVTYGEDPKSHKADINAKETAVKEAIAQGYSDVRRNESTALNNLIDMVKVQFNNAAEAGDDCTLKEQLEQINKEIEALKPQVYALPGIESNDEFKTSALALEDALSGYYVQLKESYGDKTNEATALLEALNNRYTMIDGNITSGNNTLEEGNEVGVYDSVITEYSPQYEALRTQLNSLKTAWSTEGNKLVMTAGGYNTQLDSIESQLTALNEAVVKAKEDAQAEKDRIEANQAAYDRLTGELNALITKFEGVKKTVGTYGLTEALQHDIDNIQTLINQTTAALNNSYDNGAGSLNEESVLPNGDEIKTAITDLKVDAEKRNTKSKINAALAALNAANEELGKKVVPEIKADLLNKYNTLFGEYSQGYNKYRDGILGYNDGTVEADALVQTLGEVNVTMEEIITKAGEIEATATENIYVPGNVDLDEDGIVNVADLQTLLGWIGKGVTYDQLYEESPRAAAAANINGDDVLNIADATALIQIILDQEVAEEDPTAAPRRLALRRGVQASESTYALALLSNEHGTRQYALSVNNSERFTGGQLDVKLPSGMTLTDVQATDRAADHQVMVFDNGGGWYRIIMVSMGNAEISGNSCGLLILSTEGVGTPEVENVVFSDTDNTAVSLKKSGQAMIDTIMDYTRNGVDRIYNAAGQTMRTIQKGINIIRHSNGKTSKELHK